MTQHLQPEGHQVENDQSCPRFLKWQHPLTGDQETCLQLRHAIKVRVTNSEWQQLPKVSGYGPSQNLGLEVPRIEP